MIRVGVNLLWMVPGVVGGSEEYTTGTLQGLARVDPDDLEIRLFALRAFATAYPDLADRFETTMLPISGHEKSVRIAAESSWLALQARRHDLDLMHHAGGIMPAVRGIPGVLTLHDVQPLIHPELFSPAKRAFSRVAVPRSARGARVVLTPSEFTRKAVIEHLGVPIERTKVLAHGIETPEDPGTAADMARLADEHDLRPPYVLYPAIPYAHKNHATLVEAFAPLARERPTLSLVLTGRAGPEDDRLEAQADDLGIGDRVRRLGRIPRDDLDACIRRASVLAFPSRYEGFGIPVLEAMRMGCPVVGADATAVPEVIGQAGLLVAPDDIEGWTRALARVLDDEALRSRMIADGLARGARFSSTESALALCQAYREALA